MNRKKWSAVLLLLLLAFVFCTSQGATWEFTKAIGTGDVTTTGSDGATTPLSARGYLKSYALHSETIVTAYQWIGDGQTIYFSQPSVELAQGEADIVVSATTNALQNTPWHYGSTSNFQDNGTVLYGINFPW